MSLCPLKIMFPFTRTVLIFFIAGLLFYCALSASIIGNVSHPAKTWKSKPSWRGLARRFLPLDQLDGILEADVRHRAFYSKDSLAVAVLEESIPM
ncbi:MAG: hypothetical protein DMG39_27045 [Acidobacteria bacterium]|nr:MAG: hypothetical protein DMG39_27045 [Acidobacteriota bacterium]